ncbi:hypothetical protein DHEL01_v207753 [Diaporthe helianthi]|uniref:Uncharacterized protein n=1 Tax=Diaporthe helianthi TaxID=158607 RepID=A0A2P5HUB2_DIAHE|nr:hypothetical protein DHEL01_v207753 [Diaporthe helianthi]
MALSKLPSPRLSPRRSDTSTEKHMIEREQDSDIQPVYRAIWNLFCGLPVDAGSPSPTNPTFLLDQKLYELLFHKLSEHGGLLTFFEDEIRKDWDASTGRLTLRLMAPTHLHGLSQQSLEHAITKELDRVGGKPSLRPFRAKINSGGHSRIRKKDGGFSRAPLFEKSPDGQWLYDSSLHPPFVFEIVYSKGEKSLRKVIQEFFEAMPGKICTILALEIDYDKSRLAEGYHCAASVSLWTSEPNEESFDIHCLLDAQQFRDSDGNPQPGHVAIPFSSFLPIKERDKLPRAGKGPSAELRISFADLAEFVHLAEKRQLMDDKGISPSPSTFPVPEPSGSSSRRTKIRWLDQEGNITRETNIPEAKRRKSRSTTARGLSYRATNEIGQST